MLALAGFFYLGFVRNHSSYLASNSDASGYYNVARLLRSGELTQAIPRIDGLAPPAWDYFYQQPLGFSVRAESGTMVTTYPVGLPLHLLAVAPFVGLDYAALAVNLFLVIAAAWLMITLGRQIGLTWPWSLASAALLLACPLFIFFVLQTMSDVCATVWTLAVSCAALQVRRHWAWGFAAGFAFAMAVLVRPSDLLLIFPVALVLTLNFRGWFAFLAGGFPGGVFLAWYNLKLYGAILTTGYPSVDHLFSLRFVPHNSAHFALWICALLSPFVALPALGLPWLFRETRVTAGLLLAWGAVLTGFYVFYFHSGETWWYLRFILPMFPAIIFAALLVLRRATPRLAPARWAHWVPVMVLGAALAWEITAVQKLNLALTKESDRAYLHTVRWMQAHAPSNAIVLQMQLSGSFTYYTTFTIVRWDLLNPAAWNLLHDAARSTGRPIYATLFDFEEPRAFPKPLSGKWERLARIKQISIWRLVETSPSRDS